MPASDGAWTENAANITSTTADEARNSIPNRHGISRSFLHGRRRVATNRPDLTEDAAMTSSRSVPSLPRLGDSEAPQGERRVGQRILLVISAQPSPDLPGAIAEGREPRRDYYALQTALDAD